MAKIRVLIVDDHAVLRDGIASLLALCDDMEVVGQAADGREALEKAHQLQPDVVIMDISLPIMDGLEATRRIRKENPRAKVLVLTMYENKEYIFSAVKAGASGYVPKKAVAAELVSAIRGLHRDGSFLYPSAARTLIEDYLERSAGDEKDSYHRLTDREREVLKLIAEGRTSREIAELLVVSIKTVLGYRTNIMEKLNIHNRTDLIKYAIRRGLINVDL